MSFKWDRQNRLVEYVIDGARWTGFLDDAGHVTELRDAQNNSHAPVRLTRDEAEAAGETLRTGLQRVISECAPMVTNKCGLDDLNFSSPAGKMICADDMFSEDSWMIALASEFDTSWLEAVYELTEQQLCQQMRQTCDSICNDAMAVGGLACGIVAARYPLPGVLCAAADYALWSKCRSDCAARYPC